MEVIKNGNEVLLYFGIGLIGDSTLRLNLKEENFVWNRSVPFPWHNTSMQNLALDCIIEDVLLAQKVQVIWSAGKGNLMSTKDDFIVGEQALQRVITFLQNECVESEVVIHYLSSAGALHYGQNYIDYDSAVITDNAYACSKSIEEKLLENFVTHSLNKILYIYRPSTVYGYVKNKRFGLITKLLFDVKMNNVTSIYGSENTIRDFVYVDDLSRYIVGKILSPPEGKNIQIHYCISGEPRSIRNIIDNIGDVCDKRPLVSFALSKLNSNNISYSKSLRPQGFNTTDFKTTLLMMDRQMQSLFN